MEQPVSVVFEDNKNNELLGQLLQTLDRYIEEAVIRHNGTFVELQCFASGKVGCRVIGGNVADASALFKEVEVFLAPYKEAIAMEEAAEEAIKESRRLTMSASLNKKAGYTGRRPTARNGRTIK
jgi:hypothetical protein